MSVQPNKNKLILGLDIGSTNLGSSVLDISQTSKPKLINHKLIHLKDKSIEDKLFDMYNQLELLFADYKNIEIVSYEFPVVKGSIGANLNKIVGGILLIAKLKNLQIVSYSPLTVKKVITGFSKASKDEVAFNVKQKLKLSKDYKFSTDHESDAAAIALAYTLTF